MRWAARARPDGRERQVGAVLAEHGLVGGRRRGAAESALWGERFGTAVAQLGGGFALFGGYLAGRPDLVGLDNALLLETMDLELQAFAPYPPAPEPLVRIGELTERPPVEIFHEIESEPFARGPWSDHFHGRLLDRSGHGGASVVVSLRRRGVEDALLADSARLSALRPAFGELVASAVELRRFDAVMAEQAERIVERADLRRQALALGRFVDDLVDDDLLIVPEIDAELTTPQMVVREWLGETTLDAIEASSSEAVHRDLGRQLYLAVLEQALVAGHVPVGGSWRIERQGRLTLIDGSFERLPAASLPRLWSYLRHLAGHRPEEAFEAIEGELRPVVPDADPLALRLRLRQLVPFRDGGWTERRDSLAELLALHWRSVVEMGFSPSPALTTLWHSLYLAAGAQGRCDPRGDPLHAALDDLRWLASFRRLRRLGEPREMGRAFEENLTSLMEMPEKLDRLLQLWSGDGGDDLQLRLRVADDGAARRHNALHVTLGVSALMVAVVWVGDPLLRLGVEETWVEAGSAVTFLVLGAWLLRTITLGRGA
ncbi:MAG: AarF/UbiB family protein [Acidobacteriota bacterium]